MKKNTRWKEKNPYTHKKKIIEFDFIGFQVQNRICYSDRSVATLNHIFIVIRWQRNIQREHFRVLYNFVFHSSLLKWSNFGHWIIIISPKNFVVLFFSTPSIAYWWANLWWITEKNNALIRNHLNCYVTYWFSPRLYFCCSDLDSSHFHWIRFNETYKHFIFVISFV